MNKKYEDEIMQRARRLKRDKVHVKDISSELGVPVSTIYKWVKGERPLFLDRRPPFEELTSWGSIRKRIFEERGRKCEKCGWAKKNPFSGIVPVQVDHIDGDRSNNKRDNLMVVCPNCHAMTEHYMFHGKSHEGTFGKKGVVRYRNSCGSNPAKKGKWNKRSVFTLTCQNENCGEEFTTKNQKQKYCSSKCSKHSQRKADRPSPEELTALMETMPMVKIGQKYGVSDNAVRKWAKSYGLEIPKKKSK